MSDRFGGLITAYHRLCVRVPAGVVLNDVFFPSWPTVRIAIRGSQPWSQRLGSHRFDMPAASFTGATSVAGYCETRGGTVFGFGILPEGWARLFGGDISRYSNRVAPLDQVSAGGATLAAALEFANDPTAIFEDWLDSRLAEGRIADPIIARLQAMIEDPAISRIETIAEELGVTARALASITRYNFGFTPKLLIRRARFMRALSGTLAAQPDATAAVIEAAGYWDRSHFLRDSHLFLGCSIRDFRQRRGPLNALAMEARERAIGTAV